jgi:hypothetical protein
MSVSVEVASRVLFWSLLNVFTSNEYRESFGFETSSGYVEAVRCSVRESVRDAYLNGFAACLTSEMGIDGKRLFDFDGSAHVAWWWDEHVRQSREAAPVPGGGE